MECYYEFTAVDQYCTICYNNYVYVYSKVIYILYNMHGFYFRKSILVNLRSVTIFRSMFTLVFYIIYNIA